MNWFRQDEHGKFLWPGYGENSRVLKWIFERCNDTAEAEETPIGMMPAPESLDLRGLKIKKEAMERLLEVDIEGWLRELPSISEYFEKIGSRLPHAMWDELDGLRERLQKASEEAA